MSAQPGGLHTGPVGLSAVWFFLGFEGLVDVYRGIISLGRLDGPSRLEI
jgi:hypothetical protein